MNPTNKPLAVVIGGKRYHLYFDLNTYVAFERVTEKHFLDFLAGLQETVQAAVVKPTEEGKPADVTDALQVLRGISITDIRAFLWAALHEYDSQDEPTWPLTLGKLGRLVDTQTLYDLLPKILNQNADNMRGSGEEEAGTPDRPTKSEVSTPEPGGALFGPSDADVLASLTEKSGG